MGNVSCEPRDNGTYRFKKDYKHPVTDKRRFKSVTYSDNKPKTFRLAEEELDILIAKEIDKINKYNNLVSNDALLKDVFQIFKKEHLKNKSNASKDFYFYAEKKLMDTHLWIKPAKDISKSDILTLNTSIPVAYRKQIKAFFRFSYKKAYIDSPLHNHIECPVLKKRSTEKLYYEEKELAKMYGSIPKGESFVDIRTKCLFEFFLLTGARCSEIRCAEEEDLLKNEFSINKSSYRNTVGKPKTKTSNRIVFVPDRAMEIKEEMIKAKKKEGIKSKLLFPSKNGGMLYPDTISYAFKKRNLPSRLHLYRHTYISIMIDKGISKDLIKHMVGHSDLKMIDTIYYHKTKDRREKDKLLMMQNSIL